MDNFDEFDFGAPSCSGLCQCTAINSQIRAQVEKSVKKGMEPSIRKFDEALSKFQSSILALDEEVKKQLLAIPSAVKEAVKTELKASIPESLQVEEASRAVPGFMPLAPSLPPPFTTRESPQQDESSNLHLKFAGNFPKSKSIFTKEDMKDQGASLQVELHDQFGHKVDVGPESSAKIKIFVVAGDFKIEDGDEDISKHVVTPREGKPPLLKGNCEISLSKGVASVGEIAFTDNSKSMRNGMYKLGAQVIKDVSPGVSIKAAVSDGFQVKEHRNTFNRRQKISLDDEVWHLVNIGKGKIHKKLEENGIHLVKDLLHLYDNGFNELLRIFRGDKKKLNKTIDMAKSCSQSAMPIQSQTIPDDSQKHLVYTSYEKQSEQTQIPFMTSLTAEMAKSCSQSVLPIHAQMIPDNSQKQLADTSHEKQSEQTHIPSMINSTTDEAEPFWSSLNSLMTFMNTMDAYPDEPATQPDGVTHDSLRGLGPKISSCTAFENQKELPEFHSAFSGIRTQAETVYLPTSASNIHLNATIADQGVMSYQAGEDTFNLQNFQSWDLAVDDYVNNARYIEPRYRPGWPLVLAVLRFRVAVKVSAKERPRAGKRQKLS